MIPRLHVVTDDAVLASPEFARTAAALAGSLRGELALHLRGHATPARRLHALAEELDPIVAAAGGLLLVADRVDVALATEAAGVRLGARSIPVAVARELLGDRPVASSVHSVDEAVAAARDGADFLVLGTIWATASHPGREGAGPGHITAVAARVDVPVVAIGGVTIPRAVEAVAAGAAGVAILSGVWGAADPLAAARGYQDALAGAPTGAAAR